MKALDADDVLTSGALARDIEVLTTCGDVGWATCRALDLLPDGSTVEWPLAPNPRAGRLRRGWVREYRRAHEWRAPVLPGSLCVRRELVTALGGWMALPASEDMGLVLALDAVTDGWFISEPGMLYRQWPKQATKQSAHIEPVELAARRRLIDERAHLLNAGMIVYDPTRMPTRVETETTPPRAC